ncbi:MULTISPECIES: 2,4'-dihydroxyacetophenone dioxygenase family protein [Methylocaldum]|jgi:quercetin dioxygenase-like cupin family protein|uniref:2,4'-dihydroxyacetophenone dioxygenase family protein n=1 Tax=unclassified Methylocaldum TaxID=2622260 RepID=UPI00117FB615|nr:MULTISPECIES: 2,4'-dihydroxyacetophenone dioxygenase family protein [unclassified Methylocaldum]MBP1152286.1 quercetin dioxygenase-like cupin family protein [Methylocaldum sp. RMAD-M]MVF24481.1 cupin domain-containing protein [Methylocaldum sp. BRCS4]
MLATEPFIPAAAGNHQLPWISVGHGISKKLLALFPERGEWVTLLRLEPGARIPLHRHQGEVHGYLLSGCRRLDPEGRLLGPGDYEYEPAGHVDTWTAEGDAPFVSLFFVRGAVEYLDLDGSVLRRETAATNAEEYHRACSEQGFVPLDLCR